MNLLDILLGPVTSLIEKYVPSAADKQAATLELLKLQQSSEFKEIDAQLQQNMSQAAVNQAEAASPSIWVAGWRPFIGWICGSGLAVQYLVAPFATWIASLEGHPITFPQLDAATLMPIVLGMLGVAGMRTYEKVQGVTK